MSHLYIVIKIFLVITIFSHFSNELMPVKNVPPIENCLPKILENVFKKNTIQFINFTNLTARPVPAAIFNDYNGEFLTQNVAIEIDATEARDVINHSGFDKNIFFLMPYSLEFDYEGLFLHAWFKFRTKLALAIVFNDTLDLVTNVYNKNYNICPDMEYKYISNICSSQSKTTTKRIDAKKRCTLGVSYIMVHPFVNDVYEENGGIMVSWIKTFGDIRGIQVSFTGDNDVYQAEFLTNGTFHQLVSDLNQHKQDVAIGQLFMNSSKDFPVDFGPIIFIDKLGFIHRKFHKISDYKKMIIIFDKRVWTYILITFCTFVPIYTLMIYLLENVSILPTAAMTDIFRLILGSGIPYTPKCLSPRILFTIFCMFAVTINSTYVGKLSEIFTSPPADKQEDIFEHGVRIHISWIIERITLISFYVSKRPDSRQKKEAGNSIVNMSDQELLRAVAWTQTNGTGTFLSTLWSNPTEKEMVYFRSVDDLLVSPRVTYYISKLSPFRDSLQYWTNEIFEKGLLYKWAADVIPRKNYSMLKEEAEDIVLKIAHFQIVFQLLFLGYTMAFVTLFLEMFYKKLDTKYRITDNIIYVISFLKPPPDLKINF